MLAPGSRGGVGRHEQHGGEADVPEHKAYDATREGDGEAPGAERDQLERVHEARKSPRRRVRIVLTTMKACVAPSPPYLPCSPSSRSPAATTRDPGGGVTVVATTTRGGGPRAPGRRVAGERRGDAAPGRRPARLRAAPERRGRRGRCNRRLSLWRRGRRVAERRDRQRRRGRRGREPDRLGEAARRRPALVAGRDERRARSGGDPRRAHEGRPGRPGHVRTQRRADHPDARAPRPADHRMRRARTAGEAQDRHDSRRARLLRAALRR